MLKNYKKRERDRVKILINIMKNRFWCGLPWWWFFEISSQSNQIFKTLISDFRRILQRFVNAGY